MDELLLLFGFILFLFVALWVALFGLAEFDFYCLAKWKWRFIGMF